MPLIRRLTVALAITATVVAGCSDDQPEEATDEATPDLPAATAVVPPERDSAFCVALIELTDDVRSGDLDDVESAIVETYRSVADEVPTEIATDFALVLAALEAGGPLPTDAPRATVATTPPPPPDETTSETTGDTAPPTPDPAPSTPVATVPPDPDPGFAPSDSPAERVNTYVDFVCRNSANNPGPPPTQPGSDAVVDDG